MTESVWDYPRPPRVESSSHRIRIVLGGETIVDTSGALRVLETSHPPVYYVPMSAVDDGVLHSHPRTTFCEFKGRAIYWSVAAGERTVSAAAWSYPQPAHGYEALLDHVAFYPALMDACYVDDEQVDAQAGDFYGGWITSGITGPFKGASGTWGW
ncbi:MAG TPA: DUF427 domain-containing protein [Acidimicrobiia bacterium]|nr:DUF427 domain-containing protein [Acidimicrobiia bacterium]